MAIIRISESDFTRALKRLVEVNDVESDIADLTDRIEGLSTNVEDDEGRIDYIRQLTAEFLEYIKTLNTELEGQVDIPDSSELLTKILGRSERKRYYMSKFRL